MLFRAADPCPDPVPVPPPHLKIHPQIALDLTFLQSSRHHRQAEFDTWQRAWQQVVADMSADLERLSPAEESAGDPLVLRPAWTCISDV